MFLAEPKPADDNVVDLAARRLETGAVSPTGVGWVVSEPEVRASGTLGADRLYVGGDYQLGRYLEVSQTALSLGVEAAEHLANGRRVEADDALMLCKQNIVELFMFRHFGDGFALIISKCLQALTPTEEILTRPAGLQEIIRVLARVRNEPFLDFDASCDVVDALEREVGVRAPPGYSELATILLEAVPE